VLHFVTIDLKTPGLRFLVTPPEDPRAELPLKGRSTSAFLRETGADLAINGDFFYPWKSNTMLDYYPHVGDPVTVQGYASSDGVPYGNNPKRWKLPALCFSKEGKGSIRVVKPGEAPPHNAIGGDRFLLQEGQVTGAAKASDALHPRTAAALDRSGRYLVLLVVDGRQPGYSEGITTGELALLLRRRGAYTAINLDGGGSATVAVRDGKGMPQVLNSPINHRYFPGSERAVSNHLAIFAPPQNR
jgi:exopolysaccharide biosynthesis protein